MLSGKTASLSSPSIKSEVLQLFYHIVKKILINILFEQSDSNSPGQHHDSPLGATQLVGGSCHEDQVTNNDMGSNTQQRNGPVDDPAWPYEAEDLEVNIKYLFWFQQNFTTNTNFRLMTYRLYFEQWLVLEMIEQITFPP